MRVPVGTAVTFLNPPGNTTAHCATQFYEGLFDSGPLQPGQSFTFTFTRPGEYFYNDCTSPGTTGKVVVYLPLAQHRVRTLRRRLPVAVHGVGIRTAWWHRERPSS